MKSVFTILLIFSFLGIAVFGVFAMSHGAGYGHNGCIAATVNGQPCPEDNNPLQFLAFHLDAFRSFATATFGDHFASALFLLIALVLTVAVGIIGVIHPAPPTSATNYRCRQFLESYSFPFQREFTHWLTLHEKRDPIFFFSFRLI